MKLFAKFLQSQKLRKRIRELESDNEQLRRKLEYISVFARFPQSFKNPLKKQIHEMRLNGASQQEINEVYEGIGKQFHG